MSQIFHAADHLLNDCLKFLEQHTPFIPKCTEESPAHAISSIQVTYGDPPVRASSADQNPWENFTLYEVHILVDSFSYLRSKNCDVLP